MSKRTTYETVLSVIKKNSCKPDFDRNWFDRNFQSRDTVLPFFCKCGNFFGCKYKNFLTKRKFKVSCKDCTILTKREFGKTKIMTYKQLVSIIADTACKKDFNKAWYNENYQGCETAFPIVCSCGQHFSKKMERFRESPRCHTCGVSKNAKSVVKKNTLTFEDVVKVIHRKGCKANFDEKDFSTQYQGIHSSLDFICGCSQPFSKIYKVFLITPNCETCAFKKRHEYTFGKIMDYLACTECIPTFTEKWFYENYVGVSTIFPLQCPCGQPFLKRYSSFKFDEPLSCQSCKKTERLSKKQVTSSPIKKGDIVRRQPNTYEKVLSKIQKNSCKPDFDRSWFDSNFQSPHTVLAYYCQCGEKFTSKYKNLISQRLTNLCCPECTRKYRKEVGKTSLLTYEKIVSTIENTSCTKNFDKDWYNENYQGFKTLLPLICDCGQPFTKKLDRLKATPRCKYCSHSTIKEKRTFTYEQVVKGILEEGCKPNFDKTWFNDHYQSKHSFLEYFCSCGESFAKTYFNFTQTPHCQCCNYKARQAKMYAKVIEYLASTGCVPTFTETWFHEHYKDVSTILSFECKCGCSFLKKYSSLKFDKPLTCESCRKAERVSKKQEPSNRINQKEVTG